MKMGTWVNGLLVSLAVSCAVACTNRSSENDGGGGGGGETGGSDGSGGKPNGGGAGGEGGNGEAGTTVAACEAAVDVVLTEDCDSGRQCNYELAKAYCSEGDAAAVEAFAGCFALDQGCHTPADPGNDQVRSCFARAITAHGTAASAAVRAAADALCETLDYEPLMIEVFAVMAGPTISANFEACLDEATECSDVSRCLSESWGVETPQICLR